MFKAKKITALILSVIIVFTFSIGCKNNDDDTNQPPTTPIQTPDVSLTPDPDDDDAPLPWVMPDFIIVCTTFPIYDWVLNLLGNPSDAIMVLLLQDSEIAFHNYQLSELDFNDIGASDLFIFNGGTSDAWAYEMLWSPLFLDLPALNIMDSLYNGIGVSKRASSEGVSDNTNTGFVDGDSGSSGISYSQDNYKILDYNEYVWLSLRNVINIIPFIADALIEVVPELTDMIRANATSYLNELTELEKLYSSVTTGTKHSVVVFADRFPFYHMFTDYDIGYIAAFDSHVVSTAPSRDMIIELAGAVVTNRLNSIAITNTGDIYTAEDIVNLVPSVDLNVVDMYDAISITGSMWMLPHGLSYISIMKENLTALDILLNE